MTACGRLCCKSLKTPGDKFPARSRNKPRSLIDVASGSLPKSPVSLSPGDEVPPTCLLESRVYSSKNLRSTVQKDFYNTIGTSRTSQDVRLEDIDQVAVQSQFYEYTSLMLGSARQCPAAVAFALGETVKLQDDADVVGQ